PEDLRTLYLGVIVYNPSDRPVTLDVLQSASYLSQPDAPFIKLDSMVDNPTGEVYAGPAIAPPMISSEANAKTPGQQLSLWHLIPIRCY
ncbi:MAG: DUF3370 family protein, partial [Acaryochloridaceae cyanobacterium RL_2_7]|nr:DUF3370 family protein [Acaryochloridaceae cyanobacterium RL_2_7]